MLLGASDHDTVDQILRVTVYRNWFESSNQRMPHCRWGYCHVVNNYYRDWHYYAIGGRVHAIMRRSFQSEMSLNQGLDWR
ncbi:hypothetical protein FRX31_031177 [Thalictrum thalictroides]|uniref:Pectate lyase n=1 Tax=Thalictrum thalictroides TaxID=46969 RepID=A0A7J6V508_THATH|nr:hypothetical protein FRX31_031177 [Thalictrum thalictroides]